MVKYEIVSMFEVLFCLHYSAINQVTTKRASLRLWWGKKMNFEKKLTKLEQMQKKKHFYS